MCDDDKDLLLSCWFVQTFTGLIYDSFQLVAMRWPRLYLFSSVFLYFFLFRKRFKQNDIYYGLLGRPC